MATQRPGRACSRGPQGNRSALNHLAESARSCPQGYEHFLWITPRCAAPWPSSLTVDVEVEILLRDPVVRAIRARVGDRFVELLLQVGVFLAQTDRGTASERF